MDTSGLGPKRVSSASTVLASCLSHLRPPPPLRTFPYCNCLRMPTTEDYGSVHRATMSYAKKTANLRASDTAQRYSPSRPLRWQKTAMAVYLFQTSTKGHSASREMRFGTCQPRRSTPNHAPHLS